MKIFLTVVLLLVLTPSMVWADVVWPALILQPRLFTWWIILTGLVIEYLFIRKLFNLTPMRAVKAVLIANAFSTLAGLILIPIGGLAWDLLSEVVFYNAPGWGTFNPVSWVATLIIASVINALLEGYVYKKYLKLEFRFKSSKFWWLVLANIFSVGLALASIWIEPNNPNIGVSGTFAPVHSQ